MSDHYMKLSRQDDNGAKHYKCPVCQRWEVHLSGIVAVKYGGMGHVFHPMDAGLPAEFIAWAKAHGIATEAD
jgi:hypothetical protein